MIRSDSKPGRSTFAASLLALLLLAMLAGASCKGRGIPQAMDPPPAEGTTVQIGGWGGDHAGMSVTGTEATLEFDCAHGSIDGPIPLDDQGRFDIEGLYVQEHGGPITISDPPTAVPARYSGQVAGNKMTLVVLLTQTQEKIGAYSLTLDAAPHIVKCL
jgi:hypothetical protein